MRRHSGRAASFSQAVPAILDPVAGGLLLEKRGVLVNCDRVRKRYSTLTLIDSAQCVPWLAADGPLAYTPENPPTSDYFFQYSWIMPGIFNPKTNKRQHHYFGASIREEAAPLFEFWSQVRDRRVSRVYFSLGSFADSSLRAPVAVYRAKLSPYESSGNWLVMQHGSYQWLPLADQTYMEEGQVLVYRGIERQVVFRYPQLEKGPDDLAQRRTWKKYLALQWRMLSDSTLSFNTIHDRTKRCETGFLNDETWISDQLAVEAGLEIEADGFARALWKTVTSSFSLLRSVAKWKFGPHFVVAKTPITNVRLTTFFAGEAEIRLVDPRYIESVEAIGCTLQSEPVPKKHEQQSC